MHSCHKMLLAARKTEEGGADPAPWLLFAIARGAGTTSSKILESLFERCAAIASAGGTSSTAVGGSTDDSYCRGPGNHLNL
jgi:hypothetical protein